MPAFYPRASASQMPITPPDSGSGYAYSSMHYAADPYASHQSLVQPLHNGAYDYQPSFLQPAIVPQPPSAYQYQQSSFQAANSLPPIHQDYYDPIGAPVLPPLSIHDRLAFADEYNHRSQQEQQAVSAREQQSHKTKEEKATGGVSAKLDYDMDRMTDFVKEATQSIFRHSVQSPTAFRKWVHQVLSATRLPSATIMISLHYLNDRLVHFPESVESGENQIYRLLAVALILGSKFLDDNTFINRSWSDVTAIKVTELNALEIKWLDLIHYELHIDPENGLSQWIDAWKDYDAERAAEQQAAKLAPLHTNVRGHTSQRDIHLPYPAPYSTAGAQPYETPLSARSSHTSTPHVSADPWSSAERQPLDDFYKRQNRYPTLTEIDDVNRRASEERARQARYAYAQSMQMSYYQPRAYDSAWDQQAWGGSHRYDCACSTCVYQQHYRPYPLTSDYGAQSVMG